MDMVLGDTSGPVFTVPDWVPDLKAGLESGVSKLFLENSRHDDGFAHVSMVSGMCYRLTWAERNGLVPKESRYDSQVRMDIGTVLEPWILERLEATYGSEWNFDYQVPVTLWINNFGELDGEGGTLTDVSYPAIIGHADVVMTNKRTGAKIVADVKTGATIKHKYNYALQLSQYSIALDGDVCAIIYFSRMDGKTHVEYFSAEQYRTEVTVRAKQILKFTAPGTPEYVVDPNHWTKTKGGSWACGTNKPGYCGYTACPKNYLSKERTELRKQTGAE
jgi:hypothetical protein